MIDPGSKAPADELIRKAATQWVVRRDRGLSAAETAEYLDWLNADPRHQAAMNRSRAVWQLLDQGAALMHEPEMARVTRPTAWLRPVLGGMAAAIVFGIIALQRWPASEGRAPVAAESVAEVASPAAGPITRLLPDGSTVRLNAGAEVREEYTATERRVRLIRGEAYFVVQHESPRAFIVDANGVAVRAVGTAFNVRLQDKGVDVLVTEGRVQVKAPRTHGTHDAGDARGSVPESAEPPPLIGAGQRAVVDLTPLMPQIVVSEVTAATLMRELAWRDSFLTLGGATLAELALQFERNTGRRVALRDPELGQLRIGGRFPGHDLDGFARLLEENYDLQVTRMADGSLLLDRAQ